jgi:large subunit ribosomal protein L16
MKGIASAGTRISFGRFGLKALDRGLLTSRQIEAARRAITRYLKREGKLWIRVFPAQSFTKKPNETRMGGGKGAVDHYAVKILPGRMIFEMDGVSEVMAKEALHRASYKLPMKTKFIAKVED